MTRAPVARAYAWNPWNGIAQLQNEVRRIFNEPVLSMGDPQSPAINVWKGDHGAVLTAEIPGLDPSALEISVQGDVVTLKGNRPEVEHPADVRVRRRERSRGNFARTIQLPFRIDPQTTEAAYERGILTVRLSAQEQDRPAKIVVKSPSV